MLKRKQSKLLKYCVLCYCYVWHQTSEVCNRLYWHLNLNCSAPLGLTTWAFTPTSPEKQTSFQSRWLTWLMRNILVFEWFISQLTFYIIITRKQITVVKAYYTWYVHTELSKSLLQHFNRLIKFKPNNRFLCFNNWHCCIL